MAVKRIRRVRRLSDLVRDTIALARQAGYSIAAVARMMDLPVSTVGNALRVKIACPVSENIAQYYDDRPFCRSDPVKSQDLVI
jgi:thymidine phosphorylase